MVLPQPDIPMLDRLDSLERLLRGESASSAESVLAPSGGESGPEASAESDVRSDVESSLVSVPEPPGGRPAEPAPKKGRPPASRRVADELRKRYAMGPALAWSKR